MTYRSTKTFGHEVGLSVCFRQHKAESHCRLLHGYALAVRFEFEAEELDEHNWVVDFGGLKSLKDWLCDMFDHTLLVAVDDPFRLELDYLDKKGLAQVILLPATGCEAFAKLIYEHTVAWLKQRGYSPRVRLVSAEVREHGANSALYLGE